MCPCAERTRKARNHLQPECFGCIRTHTHTHTPIHPPLQLRHCSRRYSKLIECIVCRSYYVQTVIWLLSACVHVRSCFLLLLCCCCSWCYHCFVSFLPTDTRPDREKQKHCLDSISQLCRKFNLNLWVVNLSRTKNEWKMVGRETPERG